MPANSGVSARTGNPWMSQDYVIETHDQYPRKCCFRLFGEDKIKQFNIQMGEELTVSFDIDAREYNGRWYNDVRAWNVQRTAAPAPGDAAAPAFGAPQAGQPAAPSATPFPPASDASADSAKDDLPF